MTGVTRGLSVRWRPSADACRARWSPEVDGRTNLDRAALVAGGPRRPQPGLWHNGRV